MARSYDVGDVCSIPEFYSALFGASEDRIVLVLDIAADPVARRAPRVEVLVLSGRVHGRDAGKRVWLRGLSKYLVRL